MHLHRSIGTKAHYTICSVSKKTTFFLLLGHRLADGIHLEADLAQFSVRQDVAAVEDEGRLGHGSVDSSEVQGGKLIPFSHHRDRVGTL